MRYHALQASTGSTFAGQNLCYSSDIWNTTLPSDVLVIPYVSSNEGFAVLQGILASGFLNLSQVVTHGEKVLEGIHDNFNHVKKIATNVRNKIASHTNDVEALTTTTDNNNVDENNVDENTVDENNVDENTVDENTVDENTVDENTVDENTVDENTVDENTVDENTVDENTVEDNTTEEQIQHEIDTISNLLLAFYRVDDGREAIQKHFAATSHYIKECGNVYERFKTLNNVAHSLHRFQEDYGADYKRDQDAVKKLTVCMKCLDAAWSDMRVAFIRAKAADKAMVDSSKYEFPFGEFVEFDE